MVYNLFRVYFYVVIRMFYRIQSLKRDREVRSNFPTIVVSNHPNTLVDPILCGLIHRDRLNFLANTGLFQHPFTRWFFLLHFCIPIKRSVDPEIPGFPLERSFDLSLEALESNKTIYIAAEGTSLRGYEVRKIKYGTEKIIRDFVEKTGRPIQLIVNGINYQAPGDFRSVLTMKSVLVKHFNQQNQEGSITDLIKSALDGEVFHFAGFSMEEAFFLWKLLFLESEKANYWQKTFDQLANWSRREENRKSLKELNMLAVKHSLGAGSGANQSEVLRWKIRLVFFAPLFVLMYLLTWIPRFLGRSVLKAINTYREYDATIKTTAYPLIYLIYAIVISGILFSNMWWSLPLLFLLGLMEIFRKDYQTIWTKFQHARSFSRRPLEVRTSFSDLRSKILKEVQDDC